GRSEFVLAVMADDQVFNQNFQRIGKIRKQGELLLQHFQLNDHVPEQLPPRGVTERPVIGELVNLADVMQKSAGQQKIAINLGIIAAYQVAGAEQGDDVIQQSANVGVVQSFCRGSAAIRCGNLCIGHEGLRESFEVRILKARHKFPEGAPQLVDVLRGFRQVVRKIYFRLL